MSKILKNTVVFLIILILVNFASQYVYKRFDLTADKRYTLSNTTVNIISKVKENLFITVYLEGDFPSEFQRLQIETQQYLEELSAKNNNIIINFENPDNQREELIKKRMMPSQLTVEEDGKLSEAIIFPWAEINYNDKTEIVSLLPTETFVSQEEQLQFAIENLEYKFSNAINSITKTKQKSVAIITGNGQLQDIYLYSF